MPVRGRFEPARNGRNRSNQSSRAEVRCLILFVSVAVAWIKKCFNPRRATLSGFFDGMTAKQSQKALSHS